MAGKGKGWFWGVIVVVVLGLVMSSSPGDVTCQDALLKLLPCQSYLLGSDGISIPCCMAAQSLRDSVVSVSDRRNVCECFKEAGQVLGINQDKAKQLPRICNLNINFSIDATVDCAKM